VTSVVDIESPAGVTPAGALQPRTIARVRGRVHHVEVSPADRPATFVARLVDDSGALDCVFMGRRGIAGIEPGAMLEVEGRITASEDVPVIYNPRYELLPA
jgi:hypothetical protein